MLLPAIIAFTVTFALLPVVIRALRRWRVLDLPNHRSSHRDPTPRGGGLAVVAGAAAAVASAGSVSSGVRTGFLVAGLTFGVIGLLDDVAGIPALRRLVLLFVLAALTLVWLMEGFEGSRAWAVLFGAGTVLWIVAYVNAYNFMDGINGLAAVQAVVAGASWLVAGRIEGADDLAMLGLVVAVAMLAFAPFNFPRARVFLGDAGSYFVGAALAYTAVVGLRAGVPPVAVLAPLALYGVDTAVTLVRRVARGERWYEAHREHVYQLLTSALDESHTRATLLVGGLISACAGLGLLALIDSLAVQLAAAVGIAAVLAVYVRVPRILRRSRGGEPAFA